jgi:hypothetical protein
MNKNYYGLTSEKKKITYLENQKNYFYQRNKFFGFKKISEERKNEIAALASLWLEKNINDNTKKNIIYNAYTYLNKITNTSGDFSQNDESFLFLIFVFDPELNLLQISMEESLRQNVAKRFKEEFGFSYDDRLLQLEKYYNERFPTLKDEFNHTL